MEIKNWLFNLQQNFINSKKGDQMDLKSVLIPKYHYAYQIEENDMGRACMGEERKCTRFWWETPTERNHSEDQGIDGRMVSEWILGRLAGGVEWIQLAQLKGQWRALVNIVMNLLVLVPWGYIHLNIMHVFPNL
jgi:hypothetical protein